MKLLVKGLTPTRLRFDCGLLQVGFVVDKMTLVLVFFQFFGFPSNSDFTCCYVCINHSTASILAMLLNKEF
jgi:hypothetical protein